MRHASITDRLVGLGMAKWAVHLEGWRRRDAGDDLIFLSIGEPDLPAPAAVLDTAVTSLRAGRTAYQRGQGDPPALRAIAEYLTTRSGMPVDPGQVVYVNGTQQGLFAAMMTLAETGDDVLVPDPYYATYEGVVAASGARMIAVPTLPEDGFHLRAQTLEGAVTRRSRVLLLNTPGNPTGAVLSEPEIDAIGEVCRRHDLWIICDEVYGALTFDVPFCSPFDRPQLRDRTVAVASISKSHALPGFRTGWAACPPALAPRITALSELMQFGSQPFLSDALIVALRDQHPEVDAVRRAFAERADVVVREFAGSPAVHVHRPEGGMFVMADIRATGLSGEEFAWRLLREQDVVVMPGESFGALGAGHLRLALTVPVEPLAEACRRIDRLARSLVASLVERAGS